MPTNTLAALTAVVLLTGCDPLEPSWGTDQCLRTKLFQECLERIPSGPESTTYNDWAEVVSECESAAYYQARRSKEVIEKECRTS